MVHNQAQQHGIGVGPHAHLLALASVGAPVCTGRRWLSSEERRAPMRPLRSRGPATARSRLGLARRPAGPCASSMLPLIMVRGYHRRGLVRSGLSVELGWGCSAGGQAGSQVGVEGREEGLKGEEEDPSRNRAKQNAMTLRECDAWCARAQAPLRPAPARQEAGHSRKPCSCGRN